MKYRDFFITESWKDYVVSTNPETLLYDFYVLSYLTTLPLQPGEKGFTGTFIGRDPQEIKLDIKNAENLLLPALQKQLSNALFIAICAEIRHVLDNKQDWSKYAKNKLVKNYIRNYKALKELPSEFKPTRGIVQPRLEPKEAAYTQSYQAAIKAINESGSTKEEFARIASDMFRTMKWSSAYGGEKWAQIADAYNLLNKTPQTNQQLQVAIDHAYDLQHNTGAVLNKVKNYYINNSIGWLSNALDFKANLKSVYDLLPKCSSDMRKLALEAFKTAGVKNNALQKSVDKLTKNEKSSGGGKKTPVATTGWKVSVNLSKKPDSIMNALGTTAAIMNSSGKSPDKIVKVVGVTGYDTVVVSHVGRLLNRNYKIDELAWLDWDPDNKTTTFKVGDFIKYKTNPPEPIEINGVITSVDGTNDNTSVVKITKIITLPEKPSSAVAADWKVGDKVVTYKAYMTKIGEKATFADSVKFKVGDLVHYVNDSNGNDVEGTIEYRYIDPLGYYEIIITKVNKLHPSKSSKWKVGSELNLSGQYMTKITDNSTSNDKVNKSKQYQVGDVILFSGYVCQIYKIFPEHIHLKVVKTAVSHIKLNSISEYKKRSFEKEIIGNYPMLSIKDFKIGDKFKNIDTGEVGVVQSTMYRSIVIYTVSEDGKDPLYTQINIKELVGNVEFLSKASSDELPKVDFGAGLEPEDDSGGKNVGKFVEFRDSPLLVGGKKKLIFTGKIIGYDRSSQEYSIKILSVTSANTNNYDYTVGEIIRWPDDGSLKIVDVKNLDSSTDSSSKDIEKISSTMIKINDFIDSLDAFDLSLQELLLENSTFKKNVKELDQNQLKTFVKSISDILIENITKYLLDNFDLDTFNKTDQHIEVEHTIDQLIRLNNKSKRSLNNLDSFLADESIDSDVLEKLKKFVYNGELKRVCRDVVIKLSRRIDSPLRNIYAMVEPSGIHYAPLAINVSNVVRDDIFLN